MDCRSSGSANFKRTGGSSRLKETEGVVAFGIADAAPSLNRLPWFHSALDSVQWLSRPGFATKKQRRTKIKCELTACTLVSDEHVAQLLGYLKSSRIETALLINFGAEKLHVKKYLMTFGEQER